MNRLKKYLLSATTFMLFTMVSVNAALALPPDPPGPVGGNFSSLSIAVLAIIGLGAWIILKGKSKGDKTER